MTSTPCQYIDSHAHLDSYSPQRLAQVLGDMRQAHTQAISIGTHAADWPILQQLCAQYPAELVGYTAGLHPCQVSAQWRQEIAALEAFLEAHTPLGLGECGLDYFRLPADNATEVVQWQKAAFQAQLSLLKQNQLPVVIHSRGAGAFADIVAAIDASGLDWRRFVFHCFSEGPREVKELNARGARASFTGIITFKNAQQTREALLAQGPQLLMIETDAPYLAPEPYRGQENTPAYVGLVAQKAAELFGEDPSRLAQQLLHTTQAFFRLPAAPPLSG